MTVQTTIEAAKPVLAGKFPGGQVKYSVPVNVPTEYHEAPMLAELVRAGKLPPVEDRLPLEPLIIPPIEIGEYGGTWRRVYTWANDHAILYTDQLAWWDGDGFTQMPRIAKSWDFSEGGRVVTIRLRRGHKWSDGQPFTSEDWRWVWDHIMSNEEAMPRLDSPWLSPVTKNRPKFEVIDEVTIRFTWDGPNYGVAENGFKRGPTNHWAFRFWLPSHYLKQFHPDFVDKATLDGLMQEAGVENWLDLMAIKRNHYQNPEYPTINTWKVIDSSEGAEWIHERNPYNMAVDTAGNQLPYIDRVHLTLVENLETAGLKAAAGEIDMQGRHMTLSKVPLYLKNADQTKIHMTFWPCQCPSDAIINQNTSYEHDPLIGELMRNRDFRIARSLGMDAAEIQETFFLGRGQLRSFVPEKGTPYYPGDEYLFKNVGFDVKKANQLLDGIVLKDGGKIDKRNAQGLRLRPDNGKPLNLNIGVIAAYAVDYAPVAEILVRHWEENLGIKGTMEEDRNFGTRIQNTDEYQFVWETGGAQTPWLYPYWVVPFHVAFRSATEVGRWYQTGGEKGEPGDIPKYVNPEGEYPLKTLQVLFDEGKAHPHLSPERNRLGQEMFKIHTTEMYTLTTVGGTPLMKGTFIVKNNMGNVPDSTANGSGIHSTSPAPDTFFFRGGKNDAGF